MIHSLIVVAVLWLAIYIPMILFGGDDE